MAGAIENENPPSGSGGGGCGWGVGGNCLDAARHINIVSMVLFTHTWELVCHAWDHGWLFVLVLICHH
jgi:hypothetical protein